MAAVGIMSSQTVKAARFDRTFEQWVNSDHPKNFIMSCRYALQTFPSIYIDQNTTIKDEQLAQKKIDSCDNDALIIKLDICPNHSNKFPICSEPKLTQYLHERGLDSATVAPTEWWTISHPGLQKEINDKVQAQKPIVNLTEDEWNKLKKAIEIKVNQCSEKTGNKTQCIIDVYGWKNKTEIEEGFKTLTHCNLRIASHC